MNITQVISKLISKKNLSEKEMQAIMRDIMCGKCSNAQISGFLVALAAKGEVVDEIIGATKVMREMVLPIKLSNTQGLVDTCGTGGDGLGLFNISTASVFVVAAANAKVAKHGNRSISSKSGSADVLELAGANLDRNCEQVADSINKIGIGFMFAPMHHSAMKHAIDARRELGVRTIFNILGPLTNPASAPNQVLGVYDKKLLKPIAQTLKALGSNHVMVVHSHDGLDEISIAAPTDIAELVDGKISYYTIKPEDFGIKSQPLIDIKAADSKQSLQLMQDALNGKECSARHIVALNAGAAIFVAGITDSLAAGVAKATAILISGKAHRKLDMFIEETLN